MRPLEKAYIFGLVVVILNVPIFVKTLWVLFTLDMMLVTALYETGESVFLAVSSVIAIATFLLALVIEGGAR